MTPLLRLVQAFGVLFGTLGLGFCAWGRVGSLFRGVTSGILSLVCQSLGGSEFLLWACFVFSVSGVLAGVGWWHARAVSLGLSPSGPARALVPCRWVGRCRVPGPGHGWRRRWHGYCLRRTRSVSGRVSVGAGDPDPSPSPGLNRLCRGGGMSEKDLLTSLQALLTKFCDPGDGPRNPASGSGNSSSTPGKGKGKFKGKTAGVVSGSGKGITRSFPGGTSGKGTTKGTYKKDSPGTNGEEALLSALMRLVERSSKTQGTGLLQRLHSLVNAATKGQGLAKKRRTKKKQMTTAAMDTAKSNTPASQRRGKGKGKGSHSETKVDKAGVQSRGFQPVRLLPAGWPDKAAMNVGKLRETLAKGQSPQGCVTWAMEHQVPELRNLAQVHGIKKAFAIVCLARPGQNEAPHSGGVKRLLPTTDKEGRAGLGHFWTFPLADQFPVLPSCSMSSSAAPVQRSLSILRVQIPKRFMTHETWVQVTRRPAATLKSIVEPSVFHSTFKWSQVTHSTKYGGEELVLEGFLKIDQDAIFDTLRRSGSKGIFLSQVNKDNPNPPKVAWVPKVENESDLQYLARIQQVGFSKSAPLRFRIGGGASLGLIGEDAPEGSRPKVWQVAGVPSKWNSQDLQRCLEAADFQDTTVLRRTSARAPWLVLTKVKKEFQDSQVFGVENHGICLTLSKPPPKKSVLSKKTVAAGSWSDQGPSTVAPLPDLDVSGDQAIVSNSGPVTKRAKVDDCPYEIVDCGGQGNCGWNSLGVAMALQRGVSLETAQSDIATTTKTLRSDIYTHLKRHEADYRHLWVPNPEETTTTAGGPVPDSFESWCESILRDGQWLCGLTLDAISRRCGVKIVVVEERADGSAFPFVFGPSKSRKPPVILYLRNEHFQLVKKRDGHSIPQDWEKATNSNDSARLRLRGAGKLWADNTPSQRSRISTPPSLKSGRKLWEARTPSKSSSGATQRPRKSHPAQASSYKPRASVASASPPRFRYWTKSSPGNSAVIVGAPSTSSLLPPQTVALSCSPPKAPKGKLGTVYEISLAEKQTRPWWTCQLCGLQIFQKFHNGKYSASHFTHRTNHLKRVHGINKAPPLPRHGLQDIAVRKAAQVRHNHDIAWKAVWEAYNAHRWPGSHRISYDSEKTFSRSGFTVYKQKCLDCGVSMYRGDVPKRDPCPKNPGKNVPAKTERIKLWRNFNKLRKGALKQARKERYKGNMSPKESALKALAGWHAQRKNLSEKADGTTMTLRGRRGERVGEARHPGPSAHSSDNSSFRIWSSNISSWAKHGESLLVDAQKQNVDVVCCQETNLHTKDFSVQAEVARKNGWQIVFTAPFGRNRGGLAVAVRDPLAFTVTGSLAKDTGQFLQVEIISNAFSFALCNIYQRPNCWDPELLHPVVGSHPSAPWVCCGDFNYCVTDLSLGNSTLVGMGRHSTTPIDGIFAQQFVHCTGGERPSSGQDHSVAWAQLGLPAFPKVNSESTSWKFQKCRKSTCQPVTSEEAAEAWRRAASPQTQWESVLQSGAEDVWSLFTKDLQNFLVLTGQVTTPPSTYQLGMVPKLIPAGHRVGFRQTHQERVLRRAIRRTREALLLSRDGRNIPSGLVRNITKGLNGREKQFVHLRQWKPLETELLGKLEDLYQTQTKAKQRAWRSDMQDVSKAVAWVKKTEPPPLLLKTQAGNMVAGAAAGARELGSYWSKVFGVGDFSDDPNLYMVEYHDDLPTLTDAAPYSPLQERVLRQVTRDMRSKAEGPDNVSAQALDSMPPEGWVRFTQMLNRFEAIQSWPSAVKHWKVTFLPKSSSPDVDKFRPLSIGSIVYRIWARCRVQDYGRLVDPHLGKFQAGHNCDCEVLHLSMESEYPGAEYGFGLGLDYTKAFDSTNASLAAALFARIGVPPQVLGLLKDQWLGQKRWVSFAGTVSPECLGEVPSLPQGDPWSPLALSLVLAAPTKRVQRLYPQVACMVYLDDRTLLAPDVQTLHDVYNEWEILSTVTRLRTNPSKTQCWARNPSVERWFEAHHPGFPVVPAAEILGYIVGLHPEDHPKKAACVTKNETTAARISLLPAGQKIKQLVTTALLTSAAAWGQSLNAWDLDEAAKAHLANWRLAVFGPRPPSSERASPYLKQFFILGHCSDLRFVVITRFIMTLARWYHWRSPSQEVRQAVAEQMQHIVHQVNNGLAEWGWRPTSWGRWACTADHTFSIFSNKNERAKAKHQLRQSWRKTLLLRWLQTDRRDADIGRHINLQDQIDDSFVDQLRKIFKRCTDSHVQAVMMGGMRTAASTRWAGNFEEVTEAGDMVCLDCHQENHPTVDHILWQCPAFSSLRRLPAPTCPFVRRLGWGPSVTIEESVKLLAQMGKIREAEVISRMARVRLQNRIHQIRGGGDTYSWTTKVLYKAKVLAPEVVFLGCCDGAAGAAEDWQLAAAGGGGSLRWRQFDNPEGQSSQSARMFDAKRNTKALWWWPLCLLLVSHCTGYEQNGKQEGQKNERRAKKIDQCGRSIVWRPSRVRLQLSACSACLFGPGRAGTLFSFACWYKTVRKALWWPLRQLLLRPVLSCDENGKTRRPKKERRKEHVSVEIPLYVKLPVWEMLQISEFVSKNSVDKEFVWDLWVLYLSFFALGHLLCAARHVQLLVPFAAGLDDFATCM